MESCLAVEKEVDRVFSKFSGINDHARRVLSDLINQIQSLKDEYQNASEDHVLTNVQIDILKQNMAKTLPQLVEKTYSAVHRKQGMHDVAEELARESDITTEPHEKEPFTELNHILDRLKNKDLEPALAWATVHHDNLEAQNSSLEFMLHRLKFIELLQKGAAHQTDAICYARTHFRKFVHRHEKDIQTLMGMLLYVPNGINSSPYSCLLDTEMWIEIYELFIRDACQLLGVCVNSP
ncbi:hypothetical protein NQ318_021510 [Aromia moschata]|uniref:CTLH domain-containing protein n=1 Tax=Aromia moschata TaxID=1265417 RepID=A0AAV8ZBY7_9CUCU|nr:hypothetical protein NQ318_021510 [Aromia moschata]